MTPSSGTPVPPVSSAPWLSLVTGNFLLAQI
jgi:hypothetical protein